MGADRELRVWRRASGNQVKGAIIMAAVAKPRNVAIMGAAGRDFHNFNVVYRDDPTRRVVAFTAAQIPGISGRELKQSSGGGG